MGLGDVLLSTTGEMADPKLANPAYPILDKEFAPTRGMELPARVATSVAVRHLGGRPIPSLISVDPSRKSEHARAATPAIPIATLINFAQRRQVSALIRTLVNNPAAAAARRDTALKTPRDISDGAQPRRERRGGPPTGRIACARSIAHPHHLRAKRFGYPDRGILREIPTRHANCRRNSRIPGNSPGG